MTFSFAFEHLVAYTDWDRAQWEAWFRGQGPAALAVGLGPNGDNSITTVGELVRHIFGAELRYVDRVRGTPVSDPSGVDAGDVNALFDLGRRGRQALRTLLADYPAKDWDVPREFQIGPHRRSLTPKTLIAQAVTHEIRHWAQIAAFLRMAGRKTGAHDFLVSEVFEPR